MKKRILCFGDSNTWGAIPGETSRHPDDVRWTGVLQKELGEQFTVIEEGYNGRTTVYDDPVEGRLSGIQYFGPCCESHLPLDLIILMLGTNDLKLRFSASPGTVALGFERYREALSIASPTGKRPKVLLASPILVSAFYRDNSALYDMFGEFAIERSAQLSTQYKRIADANGWVFMNAAAYAVASEIDGIHMDTQNHKKLGMAFAKKVRELFI